MAYIHKILLQNRRLEQDPETGDPIEHWDDGPTLAGNFASFKGGEYLKSRNIPLPEAQVDAQVRIRFRKGISPSDNRIIYGGVIYDIKAVLPDEGRTEVILMVSASAEAQEDGSKVNA